MRSLLMTSCVAAALALTAVAVTTPAYAGPGLGGGYEKTPRRGKAVKRKRADLTTIEARQG